MKNFGEAAVTILTSIIAIAILAVLLSNNSKTTDVLGATFTGLGNLLQVVISPITTGTSSTGTTSSTSTAGSDLASLLLGTTGTGTSGLLG